GCSRRHQQLSGAKSPTRSLRSPPASARRIRNTRRESAPSLCGIVTTPSPRLTRRAFVGQTVTAVAALGLPRLGVVPASAATSVDPRMRALAAALRGPVITPSDARYSSARLAYNGLYDGIHPLAVAQPINAADVSTIIRWARTSGVHIAVRSGGHSYGGYSS